MKRNLPVILFVLIFVFNAFGQTKEANPADVSSIDAIIKAVYDVISGDAGVKRDWDRFRTLFHPSARLIPTGKNQQTGVVGARALTVEDYITRSGPFLEKDGFFERELARRTDLYGNIAQVFSTYDSKHKQSDEKPFARGINSFQLLNDGKRWWIVTIFWQGETAETPIPKKYMKLKSENVKKGKSEKDSLNFTQITFSHFHSFPFSLFRTRSSRSAVYGARWKFLSRLEKAGRAI